MIIPRIEIATNARVKPETIRAFVAKKASAVLFHIIPRFEIATNARIKPETIRAFVAKNFKY